MPDLTLHPDLADRASTLLAVVPGLVEQPGLTVTAGTYVANEGVAFTEHGITRTPQFVVQVASGDGVVEGTTVRLDGLSAAGATPVPLLVLEERADPVSDDEETIARLLEPYGPVGRQWAATIAGAADRAASFGVPLPEVTVPPGAPSDDPAVLVAWLSRHFTYLPGTGDYYAKWTDGAPGAYPEGTSDTYREQALTEHLLDRDHFYALVVQSESSGSGRATETLLRLAEGPDGAAASVQVLYEAARHEPREVNEVCVFHTAQGQGIAVPTGARGALRPDLARLSRDHAVTGAAPSMAGLVTSPAGPDAAAVKVSAVVRPGSFTAGEDPTLPAGVTYLGGVPEAVEVERVGDPEAVAPVDAVADSQQEHVRYFLAPVDRLVELAAHPDVLTLSAVRRSQLSLDEVRVQIDHAGALTNLGRAPGEGGSGVVVGVVDSGIDGTHPAFAGRIEAVWDQFAADDPAHPPPTGVGNDFGQVWDTAADIRAHSHDGLGHGTHVAGIAAGAAGAGYTQAGIAPMATIVAVRVFDDQGNGGDDDHIRRGVEWCFRQAGQRPCVVNLSLGGYHNGHDGVDDFALSIRRTYRRVDAAGTGFDWLAGRVVTAAAGNAGQSRGHMHVAALAPAATFDMPVRVASRPHATVPGVLVTEDDATLNLFGRPLPRAARGCRFDVRVRLAGGAAQTPWIGFNAAGNGQQAMLGATAVTVFNGPAPHLGLGLQFTQHQFVQVHLHQPGGLPVATWTVEIRNASVEEIEVHGYLPAAQTANGAFPVFFPNDTRRSSVESPATAFGTISVGATINRASWRPQGAPADGSGDVSNDVFSFDPVTNLAAVVGQAQVGEIALMTDPGPMRGTDRTLTAMLPGDGILSAMSADAAANLAQSAFHGPGNVIDARTGQMTGTSMATPVATGLVALMLEHQPRLTARTVGNRLRAASRPTPPGWEPDLFGAGPTDASLIAVT